MRRVSVPVPYAGQSMTPQDNVFCQEIEMFFKTSEDASNRIDTKYNLPCCVAVEVNPFNKLPIQTHAVTSLFCPGDEAP